jgi:hypothetical protein
MTYRSANDQFFDGINHPVLADVDLLRVLAHLEAPSAIWHPGRDAWWTRDLFGDKVIVDAARPPLYRISREAWSDADRSSGTSAYTLEFLVYLGGCTRVAFSDLQEAQHAAAVCCRRDHQDIVPDLGWASRMSWNEGEGGGYIRYGLGMPVGY